MPDPDKPDMSLSDKIRELEALLEQQESSIRQAADTQDGIPILDELVTDEDYFEAGGAPTEFANGNNDLPELARKLEEKFSSELDQVVELLKGNLKNSIMEELRNQLNEPVQTSNNSAANDNESA